MNTNHINEEIIKQIRDGSEKAFSELYCYYYSYLNAIALYYLLDKDLCSEIVDDVFINVWFKRETFAYPIHYYLVRSEIRLAVNQLPLKCRKVFEEYFYAGKAADVIAEDMGLTVSTVRVQLKNATDRLKQALKHLLLFFIY